MSDLANSYQQRKNYQAAITGEVNDPLMQNNKWDRVEDRRGDDGVLRRVGVDDTAGVEAVLGDSSSQRRIYKEDDKSYIIERREDADYLVSQQGSTVTAPTISLNRFLPDIPPPILQEGDGTTPAIPNAGPLVVDEQNKETFGEMLGDLDTFLSAPAAGLTTGLVKFGVNVLSFLGVLEQEDVDEFNGRISQFSQIATEDSPVTGGVATVGEIGGQFVLPAVGMFNRLRALGATPILASVLAESGIGLAGMSPNEENLFNLIPEDATDPSAVAIRDLLATDPEDPEWENRAKNATEALTLLGGGELAIRGFIKMVEQGGRLVNSKLGQKVVKGLKDAVNQAQGRLDADADAGITRLRSGGDTDELVASLRPLADALQAPDPAPVFFSQVQRAVEALQETGTGAQYKAQIAKTPGVKAEEMAWTGLDDFLDSKKKTSKAEILDFLSQNKLEIEETVLKGKGTQAPSQPFEVVDDDGNVIRAFDTEEEAQDFIDEIFTRTGEDPDLVVQEVEFLEDLPEIDLYGEDNLSILSEEVGADIQRVESTMSLADADEADKFDRAMVAIGNLNNPNLREEALRVLEEDLGQEGIIQSLQEIAAENPHLAERVTAGQVKFATYTLPGGENYREVLLRLPERPLPLPEPQGRISSLENGKFLVESPGGLRQLFDTLEEAEARTQQLGVQHGQRPKGENFSSDHFDELNVLAHVRMNDRIGPNGEKILFIEEIQSDWHQAGRAQSYKIPLSRVTATSLETQMSTLEIASILDDGTMVFKDGSQIKYKGGRAAAVEDTQRRFLEEIQTLQARAVPDAPLKKTWHETALRRVIREASEGGYDQIAWTPGQVQADRYDLSKQLSSVRWNPDTGDFQGKAFESDRVIFRQSNVKAEDLEGLIGKDAAKKLTDQASDETVEGAIVLSGQDLQIGGEGMKGFYDKIIPRYLKKFGKKFGAKPGTTEISTSAGPRDKPIAASGDQVMDRLGIEESRRVQFWSELSPDERAAHIEVQHKINKEGTPETVHTLDITPQMRETAVREGFPLFSTAAIPLAAGAPSGEPQQAPQDGVQVASASTKFLRGLLGFNEKGVPAARKTAVQGETEILERSSYDQYQDQIDLFEGDVTVPAPGVDFNIQNLDTSDDVRDLIDTVSETYQTKAVKATKGKIPQEVTEQIATLLGTRPDQVEKIVKKLPGETEDLHIKALVMRKLMVASAEKLDELAAGVSRAEGGTLTDRDMLEFREHLTRHVELQSQFKGVQTEIARALASFRIPASSNFMRDQQGVDEIIDGLGGRKTIRELADKWLKTPIDRRSDFAEKSIFARTRHAVFEMWINGLLSSARTHSVNVSSNFLFGLYQIPERLVAASISKARTLGRQPSTDVVEMGEAFVMVNGWMQGQMEGVRLAAQAWRTEMPAGGLAKIEHQQLKAITPENFNVDPNSVGGKAIDYMGQFFRLPGRALMSEDEYFKAVAYRMQLNALAYRRASALVKNGDIPQSEFNATYKSIMDDPPEELSAEVLDFGHVATFTNELGEAGQALQKFVGRFPGARVVLPFIRTPTNIFKAAVARSPAAPMLKEVREDFVAGGARRDMALAKVTLGTGVMTYAAAMSMRGDLTGSGPGDFRLRKHWLETHKPYSIKVGDTWVPIGRLEPLSTLFGTVADAVDFIKYSTNEENNNNVVLAAFGGIIKNLGEKTFLQGIANFAAAYENPERYGANYFKRLGGTLVPYSSMLRDMKNFQDSTRRNTKTDPNEKSYIDTGFSLVLNQIKANTPGWGPDLPPLRTFWGEEVIAYEGGALNAFNAFSTKKIKESPIDEELVRLGYPLSKPRAAIGSQKLSPEQYDRLIVLMNSEPVDITSTKAVGLVHKYGNSTIRETMNRLVQSEVWEIIDSDQAKINALADIARDYTTAAREALAMGDPDLTEALLDEQVDQKEIETFTGILGRGTR